MANKFRTNDISLTAFLLTKGINLLDIEQGENSRFLFALSAPTKCEVLKKEYLNNAHAPAQELFSKREMLISQIKQRSKI